MGNAVHPGKYTLCLINLTVFGTIPEGTRLKRINFCWDPSMSENYRFFHFNSFQARTSVGCGLFMFAFSIAKLNLHKLQSKASMPFYFSFRIVILNVWVKCWLLERKVSARNPESGGLFLIFRIKRAFINNKAVFNLINVTAPALFMLSWGSRKVR